MRTKRLLKVSCLVKLNACPQQVAKFRELWGEQVYVTVPRMTSVADHFDWDWGAQKLLSAPAWAEYERVTAPALAEYNRVTAPALAEYNRVTVAAWAEHKRVTAAAWAEYKRVTAQARAECKRVTAPAWARLYIQEG